MWLQATISHEDLTHYLNDLLPMRVTLGEGDEPQRIIELGAPRRLEIVPARGVRIETHAKIQWPVLGLHVPANIRSVQVLLTPRLETRDGDPALTFGIVMEKLDVTLVPGVVESAIIDVVNAELAKEGVLPGWFFTRTLDFHFAAPEALGIHGDIRLYASWADLKITDDGLTLALSFRGGVDRHETVEPEAHDDAHDGPDRETPVLQPPPRVPPAHP